MEENKQGGWQTAVGMGLIFLIGMIWLNLYGPKKPTDAELKTQDSIAQIAQNPQPQIAQSAPPTAPKPIPDSLKNKEQFVIFGDFAAASLGTEQVETLENDLLKITSGGID